MLRERHKGLLPQIEELRLAADSIGELSRDHLRESVDAVCGFLTERLIPHLAAAEKFLYPVVGQLLGNPQATMTMSRDHVEIRHLSEQLVSLSARILRPNFDTHTAKQLRFVLYGMYELVRLNFAKEEDVYWPLLDAHLNECDARQLFDKLAKFTPGKSCRSDH
jgi:hemerythrin-like domain-containing protein